MHFIVHVHFVGMLKTINIYCLNVEVLEEKRDLYERSLKIDGCGTVIGIIKFLTRMSRGCWKTRNKVER